MSVPKVYPYRGKRFVSQQLVPNGPWWVYDKRTKTHLVWSSTYRRNAVVMAADLNQLAASGDADVATTVDTTNGVGVDSGSQSEGQQQ
jgi:hypothetical protein